MKLIAALGNPGKEYENTRHNAGFRFIDAFANQEGLTFNKNKFNGIYTEFNYKGEKVILLKPQKYMNLSGEVIRAFLNFYKIPVENLLVITDDLDTPAGMIKIKMKGSSGGHNGLKNIEQNLKTNNYKRLKIGISNNKDTDKINYVIGKVAKEELTLLNKNNVIASNIIYDYLNMTFDNFMNKYNKKNGDKNERI